VRYRSVLVLLVACGCSRGAEIPSVGGSRLNVRIGESLSSVRSKHSNLRYAPFAGWTDTLPSSTAFGTVLYQFGSFPAGERPTRGRLLSVKLVAREVGKTSHLLAQLDSMYGKPVLHGCSPLGSQVSRQEIAVRGWSGEGMRIFAESLVEQGPSGTPSPVKPVVITFVPTSASLESVGLGALSHTCLSSPDLGERSGPAPR
jgi:hypothetical protein